MKIIRIIARLNVGGPSRHVVWLTAGLQSPMCESMLVAGVVPPGEDDMSYFAAKNGVVPLIIPQMSREISPKDALTIWKLYRLFVRERPSIVHTHTAKAGTVGRIAGLLYRWLTAGALIGRPRDCRFVHTYHGHIFHSYYGSVKTRVFLAIEKILARLATDKIIVISAGQFREIHEKYGVGRAAQFAIIPLGLDIGLFNDWQSRRDAMRAELGASRSDLLVGIIGRLTEVKNQSLFLKAVAAFRETLIDRKTMPRIRFVIIGDGHLRGKLEAQARELGLGEDLEFLGSRNDPENFYPALDVVALTSLNEGTPLTLLEAMANARPLIATSVGGVVELLGEKSLEGPFRPSAEGLPDFLVYDHGIGVRPNDAEAFSRGLAHLLAADELRMEMGERGRRFVEQNYSKTRLLEDVMTLYRDLVEKDRFQVSGSRSQVSSDSSALNFKP